MEIVFEDEKPILIFRSVACNSFLREDRKQNQSLL